MGFVDKMRSWGRGQQHLIMAFHPDDNKAAIVYEALAYCLAEYDVPLTEKIINVAYKESDKYPNLTVKRFVDNLADGLYPEAFD